MDSVYKQCGLFESDPELARDNLNYLSMEAKAAGYLYLEDLALALLFVANYQLISLSTVKSIIYKPVDQRNRSNLYYCYKSAFDILAEDQLNEETIVSFMTALGRCEGIKGYRQFIYKALDKLLSSGLLSDLQLEFALRWISRFSEKKAHSQQFSSFKGCDYRLCEARCCYDGVYLLEGEGEKITKVVQENRQYFAHLPDKYIVHGDWEGISGNKTAVRDHDYKSPDFPSHFTRTRCVFALEDGACSLQKFASENGLEPWQLKPVSCVMHPVRVNASEAVSPAFMGNRDPDYVDLEYPG